MLGVENLQTQRKVWAVVSKARSGIQHWQFSAWGATVGCGFDLNLSAMAPSGVCEEDCIPPGMHLGSWSHLSYTQGSCNQVKPHSMQVAGCQRGFARERMIYSEQEELQYLILAAKGSRNYPRNPIWFRPPFLGCLEQELDCTEIWFVIRGNIYGDNMMCQLFCTKWLF